MKIGRFSRLLFITLCSFLLSGQVLADKIKVAGIYTQPLQQKWDARLHLALQAAADRGEIEYVLSEKVSHAALQPLYHVGFALTSAVPLLFQQHQA